MEICFNDTMIQIYMSAPLLCLLDLFKLPLVNLVTEKVILNFEDT